MKILEDKCHVRKIILEAAKAKAGNLYLGLDISTQNTGYTVLAPAATESTTADVDDDTADDEAFLRERLGARLVEWGCIVGSGKRARDKKDVVDVGIIIEERLREVAERCSGSRGENETRATEAGVPELKQIQMMYAYLAFGVLIVYRIEFCLVIRTIKISPLELVAG